MVSGIDLPLCPNLHWEVRQDQNAGEIRSYKWRGNTKQLLITTTSSIRSSRGHAFADVCEIVVAPKQKPAQIQEIKSLSQMFEARLTRRRSDIFRDLKCSAIAYQRPKPHRDYLNLPETILIFRLPHSGCEFFVTRTEFSKAFTKQSIDSLLMPVMLLARPLWPNRLELSNTVGAARERLPDHPSRSGASVTRLDRPHLRAAAEKDRGLRSKSKLQNTVCNEHNKALSRFMKPDTSSQMVAAPALLVTANAAARNVCRPTSLSRVTDAKAISLAREQLDTCKHRLSYSDIYKSVCIRENQQGDDSGESRTHRAENVRPCTTEESLASTCSWMASTNSKTATERQTKHDTQLARHDMQKVSLGESVKPTLMSLPQEIRDMILDVAMENLLDQTVALCEHTKSQHPGAVFMVSRALRRQAYDRIWASRVVIQQKFWRISRTIDDPRLLRVLHKARNFRIEIDMEHDDFFIPWLKQIWNVEKTIHKLTVYCRPDIDSLPKLEPHVTVKEKILDVASGFSYTITWEPESFNEGPLTPLYQILCQEQEIDLDILAFVLQRSNKCLNRKGPGSLTPLMISIGRASVVELLVNTKGIDCNQAGGRHGYTPLHCAALDGEHACARILIDQPTIDVSRRSKSGETALDVAVEHGHTSIADLIRAKDNSV